jgi:hypothetical protein
MCKTKAFFMISYKRFGKLNFEKFVTQKHWVQRLKNYECMDQVWTGKNLGSIEWLQLGTFIKTTKYLSVNFNRLSDKEIDRIMTVLGLHIKKDMQQADLVRLFGQPQIFYSFENGYQRLEYQIGDYEKYYLSVLVRDDKGINNLVLANFKKLVDEVTYCSFK